MEQPTGSPLLAALNTLLSVTCSAFAMCSIGDIQALGGLLATGIAITSGCFAIRYYHLSIKEKLK